MSGVKATPGYRTQWIVVVTTLATLIMIAHAHRPGIEVSPEARIARRYHAQVSDRIAYAHPKSPTELLNLTLEDSQGARHALSKYHGQVVLLNFWASWYAPCLKEMPDLEGLAREMDDLPFSLVALSSDDGWESIHKVLGDQKLKMEVYRDPTSHSVGKAKKQQQRYGTEKLPETYVIDKQGNIRLRFINVQPWKDTEIRSYLEWLTQQ